MADAAGFLMDERDRRGAGGAKGETPDEIAWVARTLTAHAGGLDDILSKETSNEPKLVIGDVWG